MTANDAMPITAQEVEFEEADLFGPLLEQPEESCAFVIFGASGDLTRRKLIPALYNLACQKLLPHGFAIIGFAVTPMTDESFREDMQRGIAESHEAAPFDQQIWDDFGPRLHYITAGFEDAP